MPTETAPKRCLWGCALDAHRLSDRTLSESAWRTDKRMRMYRIAGHSVRLLDTGGKAPVLLLAADAPVVLEHYIPLIDLLAPERRVVALEMPGFGFSSPSRDYRFTLSEQVDFTIALLDALHVAKAHFAFTCVNALIACAIARRSPERVEKLTLGQMPSVEEYRNWARRIDLSVLGQGLIATPGIGQLIMALAPGQIAAKWFHGVSGPSADGEALTAVSRRVYGDGGAFCLAAINQALQRVRPEEIGPIDVPTTFLWGAADASHRRTDRKSSLTIAPSAEFEEWSDLGHCFDIEDPERVAHRLLT
ncbi:hypothetical protein NOR53_2883 [gamma proteobacterium NOR5-3]|nr:hypothetical protein NOR53_2883 [gamma proteobacterium NOR5-3]